MDTRRISGAFFLLQAAAIPSWWLLLGVVPASRRWFLPADVLSLEFQALVAPDVVVFAGASAVAGVLAWRERPAARTAAWIAAGSALYATAFTIHWSVLTGAPVLSSAAMVASAILTVLCARRVV